MHHICDSRILEGNASAGAGACDIFLISISRPLLLLSSAYAKRSQFFSLGERDNVNATHTHTHLSPHACSYMIITSGELKEMSKRYNM